MNIPINVLIPNDMHLRRSEIMQWLINLNAADVVFMFPYRVISFGNEEDATAFMLTFNATRKYLKIDQLIEQSK